MEQLLEKAAQTFIKEVNSRHTVIFTRKEVEVTRRPAPSNRPKSNIFDCTARKKNGVEARGSVQFDNWFTTTDIEYFNDPRNIFIPESERLEIEI